MSMSLSFLDAGQPGVEDQPGLWSGGSETCAFCNQIGKNISLVSLTARWFLNETVKMPTIPRSNQLRNLLFYYLS